MGSEEMTRPCCRLDVAAHAGSFCLPGTPFLLGHQVCSGLIRPSTDDKAFHACLWAGNHDVCWTAGKFYLTEQVCELSAALRAWLVTRCKGQGTR